MRSARVRLISEPVDDDTLLVVAANHARSELAPLMSRFKLDPDAVMALAAASPHGHALVPARSRVRYLCVCLVEATAALWQLRHAVSAGARALPDDVDAVTIWLAPSAGQADVATTLRVVAEAAVHGRRPRRLEGGRASAPLAELRAIAPPELSASLRAAAATGSAANWARDLVELPPDELDPPALTAAAVGMARAFDVEHAVWDEQQLRSERFAGLLAVCAASPVPASVVELKSVGDGRNPPVILVGKGMTFDSGGLQSKAMSMEWNKADMAGAATVLAALRAVRELETPLDVRALVLCAENLGGPKAYRPGSVVSHRDGRTVEISNTDAEGRVVLADALTYAAATRPRAIIDVATLTNPYGPRVWGWATNDDWLARHVEAASDAAGEPSWRVPLFQGYRAELRSSVADLMNHVRVPSVANDNASVRAITAALFLETFVGGVPWLHLDITGPAFHLDPTGDGSAGATGAGVATLVRLLERLATTPNDIDPPHAVAERTARQDARLAP
jgi:leucyl aminopeptidase